MFVVTVNRYNRDIFGYKLLFESQIRADFLFVVNVIVVISEFDCILCYLRDVIKYFNTIGSTLFCFRKSKQMICLLEGWIR